VETLYFVLMPDESLKEPLSDLSQNYLEKTLDYWLEFSRILSIPFEWQEQVIRSVITLKMCSFEETGAMIASITTSIPISCNEQGYDLRFCWLRDSANIIHTLNKLGSTKTMEDFLKYISNIVADSQGSGGSLQPVYGISLEKTIYEKEMHRLAGYRGLGPVRVGTRDYKLVQNDVYGHVILATAQMFFDHRLKNMGDKALFERLEGLGAQAVKLFDQPDAGPLGLVTDALAVYTFSSVMCWVAADRLSKIAHHLNLEQRAAYWGQQAKDIQAIIYKKAWNDSLQSFTETWGGEEVDGFLLLLPELGFLPASDPRFLTTLDQVEKSLKIGEFLVRSVNYKARHSGTSDHPQHNNHGTWSTTTTMWYINALGIAGRRDEARQLFERMLSVCNPCGLLSETVDSETGELWGNFPKTTAMVGLIECALRLSKDWEEFI